MQHNEPLQLKTINNMLEKECKKYWQAQGWFVKQNKPYIVTRTCLSASPLPHNKFVTFLNRIAQAPTLDPQELSRSIQILNAQCSSKVYYAQLAQLHPQNIIELHKTFSQLQVRYKGLINKNDESSQEIYTTFDATTKRIKHLSTYRLNNLQEQHATCLMKDINKSLQWQLKNSSQVPRDERWLDHLNETLDIVIETKKSKLQELDKTVQLLVEIKHSDYFTSIPNKKINKKNPLRKKYAIFSKKLDAIKKQCDQKRTSLPCIKLAKKAKDC